MSKRVSNQAYFIDALWNSGKRFKVPGPLTRSIDRIWKNRVPSTHDYKHIYRYHWSLRK